MSEKYRLIVHTAARLRFVEENGLAGTDFEFARYLSTLLGHALGELVEVPVRTWGPARKPRGGPLGSFLESPRRGPIS